MNIFKTPGIVTIFKQRNEAGRHSYPSHGGSWGSGSQNYARELSFPGELNMAKYRGTACFSQEIGLVPSLLSFLSTSQAEHHLFNMFSLPKQTQWVRIGSYCPVPFTG